MSNSINDFLARGGGWTVVQFLLLVLVLALGWWWRGEWPAGWRIAGLALLGMGGLIFGAGWWVLGRNLTPYTQPRTGGNLVRRGIYARIQHPLYTGVMAAALGWALYCHSLAALIVALGLIPFFHGKARAEERWLRHHFPDYAEYARRVPRFLPRLRS